MTTHVTYLNVIRLFEPGNILFNSLQRGFDKVFALETQLVFLISGVNIFCEHRTRAASKNLDSPKPFDMIRKSLLL